MYREILVGVDEREQSRDALALARLIAAIEADDDLLEHVSSRRLLTTASGASMYLTSVAAPDRPQWFSAALVLTLTP
jgi:nucleotide-binding universal stress UspA family protein